MRGLFLRHGAAVLLLLLVGCSGDSDPRQARLEASFQKGFTAVSEEYRTAMAEVQGDGPAALESQDRRKLLAGYRAIDVATTRAAKKFSELTPPTRVAEEFDDLLANLDEQRTVLDGVVAAVKSSRPGSLTEGLAEFSTLLGEFGTIQKDITTALADA